MAAELTSFVDRCIFSFVEMYKKLEFNMPELNPLTEAEAAETYETLSEAGGTIFVRVKSVTMSTEELIAGLKQRPNVIAASPNRDRRSLPARRIPQP